MKHSIATFLVLLVLISSWPISAASPRGGLSVVDQDGRRTHIGTHIGMQTGIHVIAVATWCGYSAEFVQIIKDPRIARHLRGSSFYFVLGNEWPRIEQMIDAQIASGDLDPSAKASYKQQLESRADPVVLADPDFLHDLPGDHFFVETFPGELGYPSRYVPGINPFEDHALEALIDAGVPQGTLMTVIEGLRDGN